MTPTRYLEGMPTVDEVIRSALALPLNDRSYVTSKLIESLNQDDQLSPEEVAEYDARIARFESGEAQGSTSEELDAKIQKILQR